MTDTKKLQHSSYLLMQFHNNAL